MKLKVDDQHIKVQEPEFLVAGSVNEYQAEFDFSPDWEGYSRTAVFLPGGGTPVESDLTGGVCVIPWEVLRQDGWLRIGVYGVSGEKRRPTIYTDSLYVHQGAGPGATPRPPTPDLTVYSNEVRHIVTLDRGDYDSLPEKDPATLYLIRG